MTPAAIGHPMKNPLRFTRFLQGIAGLAWLSGSVAFAQPAPTNEFEKLMQRATQAAEQDHFEEAIAAWTQAYALEQDYRIACSIARHSLRVSRPFDAAKWFNICKRTAAFPKTEEGIGTRVSELAEFELAKAHLVQLTLDADPGASIFVNGQPEGVAPLHFPLFAAPGHIAIEARKDQQIIKREIDGQRGQALSISLTSPPFMEPTASSASPIRLRAETTSEEQKPLASALRPTPLPSVSPYDQRSFWQRAQPWVVFGSVAMSAAALGTGLWLRNEITKAQFRESEHLANGVLALGANDIARAQNEVGQASTESQQATTLHHLSIACFVASGVFGGTAVTAYFVKGKTAQPTSIGFAGRFTW